MQDKKSDHHKIVRQRPPRVSPKRTALTAGSPEEQTGLEGIQVNVGLNLRRLRTEKGLSLRALAEICGLAINTLSLIENGRTSPSVSTLQQIAAALEVPMTAFFENGQPKRHIVHHQSENRPRAKFIHGYLEDLGVGLNGCSIEPLIVTLKPDAGSGTRPIVHTGHEFVYCLKGRIRYSVENQDFTLGPGDSLFFESHLPHCWQNLSGESSQAILVLCPSDDRDRPSEVHFHQNPPR